MIKSARKLGTESSDFNIIKAVYDRPMVNVSIWMNGEKLKEFPLKSET
jgi:hypothetical protein